MPSGIEVCQCVWIVFWWGPCLGLFLLFLLHCLLYIFYFLCNAGNITFSNAWLILVLLSVYVRSEWSNNHLEFSEMLCLYFEFEVMFEGIGPAHLFRVKPVGQYCVKPLTVLSAVVVADLGHTQSWLMLEECKGLFEASCVFVDLSWLRSLCS